MFKQDIKLTPEQRQEILKAQGLTDKEIDRRSEFIKKIYELVDGGQEDV
jgi:hypothetical protein